MSVIDAQLNSTVVQDALFGLAQNTKNNYYVSLRQFTRFLNTKDDLKRKVTINDFIDEGKADITSIQNKIDLFYKWLLDEPVKGYKKRGKGMRESSAHQRAYAYLRGFFVNLDMHFEKKWKRSIPKPKLKQAIKKDKIYTFYDVDEKSKKIVFNKELMQQFLSNLKLRDIAITLSLLSSALDSGDLFKLNVGDIRQQKIKIRIFLEGTRTKTNVPFRTFFSKEATRFIRKYIEQERQFADDDDPLFVCSYNGKKDKRMSPENLSSIMRHHARKMGVTWKKHGHNPLRPKRMRHLFRTGADTAGVNEIYTNAFMGHRNHMGQSYSELSKAKLELEYVRVEPFLTVYAQNEENLETNEDVRKLESRIVDLNREIEHVKNDWMRHVEHEAQQLFNKWANEWQKRFQEDMEAQEVQCKFREKKV